MCDFTSKASVLFWYQYPAVLIAVALVEQMPTALFFLLRIVLAMWALFWFHMKFRVVFPSSVKKVNGSLMEIALNL